MNNIEKLIEKNSNEFLTLYEEYTKYNSHTNISSIKNKDDVYKKHFEDSLEVLPFIIQIFQKHQQLLEQTGKSRGLNDSRFKIVDIGTGGGFPALPLAIVLKDEYPNIHISAVDSVGKKIKFVQAIKTLLKLDNLEVIHSRAEDLRRSSFDMVLSRAVANLPTLLEYAVPLLKISGIFIAFKKQDIDTEIKNSAKVLKVLGGELVDVYKYDGKQLLFFKKH